MAKDEDLIDVYVVVEKVRGMMYERAIGIFFDNRSAIEFMVSRKTCISISMERKKMPKGGGELQ